MIKYEPTGTKKQRVTIEKIIDNTDSSSSIKHPSL
jgi:hypothetical protein